MSFWQLEAVQHCLGAVQRLWSFTDCVLVTLNVNDDDDDDKVDKYLMTFGFNCTIWTDYEEHRSWCSISLLIIIFIHKADIVCSKFCKTQLCLNIF